MVGISGIKKSFSWRSESSSLLENREWKARWDKTVPQFGRWRKKLRSSHQAASLLSRERTGSGWITSTVIRDHLKDH